MQSALILDIKLQSVIIQSDNTGTNLFIHKSGSLPDQKHKQQDESSEWTRQCLAPKPSFQEFCFFLLRAEQSRLIR